MPENVLGGVRGAADRRLVARCGAGATAPERQRGGSPARGGLLDIGTVAAGRCRRNRRGLRTGIMLGTALHLPLALIAGAASSPRTVAPPSWTIKDAEKLYNMSGWGLGYFRVSPEGHVTVHPDTNRKRGLDLYQLAMDLNAQGVGLPLLLRFSDILRSRIHALASEFQQRHQGIRLRGHLHHRLPGEGEPAAPRGAGDRGVRRPARRGPRVRQQARAPGHPRPQREHRPPHRLQRLQGRGVHAPGAHGAEARAQGDDRAGAAHRARGPAQGGRRDGRAADGGRPGQARHRGLRPVGQERRRALQVRARRGGADAAARSARPARPEGHPQAGALPPGQPDHRHPLREGGARRDRPVLRRAARHGLRPHARGRGRRAWGWTTTARARPGPRA